MLNYQRVHLCTTYLPISSQVLQCSRSSFTPTHWDDEFQGKLPVTRRKTRKKHLVKTPSRNSWGKGSNILEIRRFWDIKVKRFWVIWSSEWWPWMENLVSAGYPDILQFRPDISGVAEAYSPKLDKPRNTIMTENRLFAADQTSDLY